MTTTLNVSFSCIFFIFFLTGHLGNFSVTHCTVTSCGFIGRGLLSSTLVKLSTPLRRPPRPSPPPIPPSTYTKMLTCWSAGSNQRNESRLPGTWGDRLEIPGIHIFICSEFCVNMRTKAGLEFGPSWHICTFCEPISDSDPVQAEVSILSKRKPLQRDNLASLSGHPYFSSGSVIHCS